MSGPAPVQQQPTSAWSMYRAIVGIGAFCALIIVTAYQATADRIRENQDRFLAQASAEVLPAATSTVAVKLAGDGSLALASETGELPAFLGYGPDNRLVGAVIAAQGMGYQDNIRVLYAYSFDQDAIVGFKILDSKETPGLGDRVEKEAHFLANFERLDASLDPAGDALANPIVTVKQGQKTEPWQLDGITGATITSEAIGNILNQSASRWVPALEGSAGRFAERSTPEGR
ncbi:MAG: FMN-binding protein [Gammaproteobacteria bacterium]|nr:FMN-binding protein [Gammaproteobacteria bacterium]MDH4256217.1 FMN-binding protein [Gammaproteobacteria bacterium]